jgi:hypothetical protein
MPELQKIRCQKCNKLLLEAIGEGKKICPKCGTENYYISGNFGVMYYDDYHNGILKNIHSN